MVFSKTLFPRTLAGLLAAGILLSLSCNQFKQLTPTQQAAPQTAPQTAPQEDPQGTLPEAAPEPAPNAAPGVQSEVDHVTRAPFRGMRHDLSSDERAGGHTLGEHVGRTNDQLRDRLAHESISAASTYTDRSAAEFAVGNALEEGQTRIEKWMQRSGSHPNLVLDYHGDQPIGRTLHREDSSSRSCSDARVVLRWISSDEYYVLTSYPECR
jgi:hypothetical protein